MYPVVYFREYHFTQLWQTSAIIDILSPLLVCYNEGSLYLLEGEKEMRRAGVKKCNISK
jgi:hypothetical protein